MRHPAHTIHEHFKTAKKAVVVPHPNPDGDAFGSAGVMHQHLNNLGIENKIFCPTPISPKLRSIIQIPETALANTSDIFFDSEIDTIVVLDSGDLRYAGIAEYAKKHPATIINIDHHATNEFYGEINFVNTAASATAELVYEFFKRNRITVTPKMSTALLIGLITDTDNFTNSATTPSALAIAGELVRLGANYKLINYHTQKDKSLNLLKLWGAALSRLTKNEKKDIVYTYLTRDDFDKYNIDEKEGEGLANFMNNIRDAKITLIIKETSDGKIKGSFRTTFDDIDVSILAKKIGGGGHKKAAGFTAEGTIEEVIEKVLTMR